jgi:hypothetical protein
LQPEIIDRLLAGILPYLAEAIMERLAQATGNIGAEMANEALASMANFVNSEHNARLGIVIVVANGNAP